MKKVTVIVAFESIILIILLAILASVLQGLPRELVPEWKRSLYEENKGSPISLIECQGDIYVLGINSSQMYDHDLIISRYNTQGELVWETVWGTFESKRAYRAYSFNSSIYIVGATGRFNANVLLLKCKSDGQIEWVRTWDGDYNEMGYGITIYQNYIYIIGNTWIKSKQSEIFLLKYDLEGDLIWDRSWSSQNIRFGYNIIVHEGYIYALGEYAQYSAPDKEEYLLKYDLDGNPIWNRTWEVGDYYVEERKGLVSFNGGIYVVGTKSIGENRLLYIKKFNDQGKMWWEKTWARVPNSRNYGMGICEYDNYLYVVGKTTMDTTEDTDVVLLKYDAKGNLIWSKLWGEKGSDRVIDIACINGFLYLLGNTNTDEPSGSEDFILKVDTYEFPINWGTVIIILGIIFVVIMDAIVIYPKYKAKSREKQINSENQGRQISLENDGIDNKDLYDDNKES